MTSILREIKRRRMIGTTVLYVLVCWGLIQVADILTPSLRMSNKSRLLLTSGRDHPMTDDGSHDTSIFATAFIEVLEKNDTVLTAPALFLAILDQLGDEQTAVEPEFKAIKRAGDEVGDFFFVAR